MPDYDPQTWVNDDPATPLSAERLAHIEQGIDAANEAADAALTAASAPSWESIGGKPETYPPATHKHGVNDLNPGDLKMTSYGFTSGAAQLTSDGSAVTVNGNLYTTGFGYFEKSVRFKGAANTVTVEGNLVVNGTITGNLDDPRIRKSGWRSLAPATWFVNGWTATGLYVKRSGDLVEVRVYGLNGAAATAPTMTNALPAGFRFQNLSVPAGSNGPVAVISNTPAGALSGAVVATGTNGDSLRSEARASITAGRFVLIGTTTEAWVDPASYPGTAL